MFYTKINLDKEDIKDFIYNKVDLDILDICPYSFEVFLDKFVSRINDKLIKPFDFCNIYSDLICEFKNNEIETDRYINIIEKFLEVYYSECAVFKESALNILKRYQRLNIQV